MTKHTVLVVEDEAKIRALLRNVLEDEGFGVLEAHTAADVTQYLQSQPISLITLDISLGAENGLELARDIRKRSGVPIIMVTGKDDVIDRVVGLEVGADDYITKPFHVREFVARVRSVLRRVETAASGTGAGVAAMPVPQDTEIFRFDEMTAIPDKLQLLDRDGADSPLTSGDFKLLAVLLERPKRVLSRDQLMDLLGGQSWSPLDRTVDNQIARLRKKIERNPSEPQLIKTVRGVGYILACDVARIQPDDLSLNNA